MTSGTFDLLHYGHIRLLKRAKAHGDYLIVGLSTDQFCLSSKNKKVFYTYSIRKEMLEALSCVDKVIPEYSFETKFKDFQKYGVNTFIIGDDYKNSPLIKDIPKYCKLVFLKRTRNISTTQIKTILKQPS